MLKNNIEVDVKVKCIEKKTTQAELAKEISITPSYVNRLIRKNENVVNKTFLAMMEKSSICQRINLASLPCRA